LLAAFLSLLTTTRAQTAGAPRPRSVGELEGLWECVDVETRLTQRLVEFSANDSYSEIIPPGINRIPVQGGSYGMKNGLLTMYLTAPRSNQSGGLGGRAIVLEAGRIDWQDADLFMYKAVGGQQIHDRNRVHEFKRLDALEDPASAGSIAGTWHMTFPIQQGVRVSLTLGRDGSYEDSHSRFNSPDPRYARRYNYERSILTLLVVSRNQPPIVNRRGKVAWRDPDHFALTLYSGDVLNVPTWKMEVECEREGATPQTGRRSRGLPAAMQSNLAPAPFSGSPVSASRPTTQVTYGNPDDYVGIWDCTDLDTGQTVRVVTFNSDGTYRDVDSSRQFNRAGRFRGDVLNLYLMEEDAIARKFGDGVAIREHGDVEWQGRDCFRFTMRDGTHLNNRFRVGALLEFRRRPGSGLAAKTAGHDQSAAAIPVPRRDQPRKIGEFIGLWKCKDPALNKTIRSVELKADGTCEFYDLLQSFRHWPLSYSINSGELAFPVREKNMIGIDPSILARFPGAAFVERGRVSWVDADLFRYELIDGRGVGPAAELHAGEVLEFHRAVGDSDPARTGKLVGKWQQLDPRFNHVVATYDLRADGSYTMPVAAQQHMPSGSATARSDYSYSRDGVLTLTEFSIGRPALNMMRGEVNWVSPNEFIFTVVDGARVANVSGQRITFRRLGIE
jgi:hypothetical protein